MRYSILGKTGLRVSVLGFGCMRLPMKHGKVDRDLSNPLLSRAVELGVNFFDTAVGYCNCDSQAAIGDALRQYRSRIILSTKNHLRGGSDDAWLKPLYDSLRLLQTDYIDLYHIHGLNWRDFVEHFDPDKGGKIRLLFQAKQEGLIRHIAFSFHDTPENLIRLVDTGYFESVICQYNLLDQANAEAMQYAHEKGLGVVVMGPVGGGRLGLPADERLSELLGGSVRSTPEAALRFVWAHPAVNVALSGMENLTMLEENVRIASNKLPFTAKQIDTLNRLVRDRKEKSGLYCSGCGYCLAACPQAVQIPDNLEALNRLLILGLSELAHKNYAEIHVKAAECVSCGACVAKCPQKIDIPRWMRETVLKLDPRTGTVACIPCIESIDSEGRFTIRVHVVNLCESEHDVEATLSLHDGKATATARFAALGSLRREILRLHGQTTLQTQSIRFTSLLRYDGHSKISEYECRFLTIRRGLDDNWDTGTWVEVKPPEGSFPGAKLHGFRFKLSYDQQGFLLLVDVRDDFLFPSRKEDHKGMLIDCLEVFLDLRPFELVGRNGYEPGVCQIFMYPGTPGKYPAFLHSLQQIDLSRIGVEGFSAPHGYRIRALVPFECIASLQEIPRKIGFDIAANTADAQGNRIAQYVYAGGPDNWKNASGFCQVWLV